MDEYRIRIENPDEDIDEMYDRWCQAVGQLMLVFGEIEKNTYVTLQLLLCEELYGQLANIGLARRLALIPAVFRDQGLPAERLEVLKGILKEVGSLAEIRNTIAHNPLSLGVREDRDEYLLVGEQISDFNNENRSYSFEEITSAIELAERLGGSMVDEFRSLSRELSNIRRR